MPHAFAAPSRAACLSSPRRRLPAASPRRPRHRRAPTCSSSPRPSTSSDPRRAVLFTTGERLSLTPAQTPASPSTSLYILCPSCPAAYVGNAVTSSLKVKCQRCSAVFSTDPSHLFQAEASVGASSTSAATLPPLAQPKDGIACAHFGSCPGCTLEKRVSSPPVLAHASTFLHRALRYDRGFTSVQTGPSHGWRTHAKLAVRRPAGAAGPRLGLFRAGTHELVVIPSCSVHAPPLNAAAAAVERALNAADASAYNDFTGDGQCRYVLLTMHRPSGKVQVTLVWNAGGWKDALPMVRNVGTALWKGKGRDVLHSVWINWNTSGGNAIVTPEKRRFYHMYGPQEMVDSVMGVEFCFQPFAFRQANLDAFEKLLLPKLLEYVHKGAAVAEFCAGVGVIGLVALKEKQLRSLVASEINEAAEPLFWKAYRSINKEGRSPRVEYVVGSDLDTVDIIDDETQIVIVDPPRAGLTPELVEMLAEPDAASLRRIIYVSCGFKAFQRDSRVLCNGQWKLTAAHGFILFPGSDHIETLAIFDRVQRKSIRAPASAQAQGRRRQRPQNNKAR